MRLRLTRRYRFSASHRLHCAELGEEENRAVYGKCNNPHGHGHNYALEVTVSGEADARTGMICDLSRLDETVRREALQRLDHQNLNVLPEFARQASTTENLARLVDSFLRPSIDFAHLEQVRIEETPRNSFVCGGDE